MKSEQHADAIRLSALDNVATVLRDVKAGERLRVRSGADIEAVVAAEAVALCHKISLVPIATGAPIRKFGETIGVATAAIAAGSHVHIQNLTSRRARKTA